MFKVAQLPYRFPRSAPNSIRYFRHLIKPPRQTPAAQSPRLVQGGERTQANKVSVCNSNGNLRSACISSIVVIVIRTGLLWERVARQRRVRVSRLRSVMNTARNDPHPALRATFSQREKDSLAACSLTWALLRRWSTSGHWERSRARCQLIFVQAGKSLLRCNSAKYELLDASILRLQGRDLGHVEVSFRIRRHMVQRAELSRRRACASKSIQKL